MSKKTLAGRLLQSTILAGAVVAIATPAMAQDDEIVITGSRLNQANLSSPSPVTQVDAEEVDVRGITRVEDLLNVLPQAFAGQTSEVSNGATGTSNLNLRGLGAIRTLVLIDGKRLPFGSPNSSPANLDLVPAQLIERVDIVTGGASAVYGSDAIGGVANFILRRDFEGLEVDGQFGFYNDKNDNGFAQSVLAAGDQPIPGSATDGEEYALSAIFGANTPDGRGNVTAYFSYQNQNAIEQGERDISGCAFGVSGGPTSSGGIACVGSSTSPTGRFFSLNGDDPTLGTNDFFLQPDGQIVPFVGGTAQTYNFNPLNFFQRPNERFNFSALMRYEINDKVEAYADLTYVNNNTDAQIAESGTFGANGPVPCSNPFLGTGPGSFFEVLGCTTPADTANVLILRRNVEGGGRNSNIDLTTYRAVGGFRGDIDQNTSWDIFGQFARTRLTSISSNDISIANLNDALNVSLDANGNPVCTSGNAGCVPYNVFQIGGVTPEAVDFITADAFVNGTTEQTVLGGTIQTDLTDRGWKFPMADAGVQLLGGFETRRDILDRRPDSLSATPGGGLTGVGGATLPVSGQTVLTEFFFETQVPLIQGRPGIEELSFNGAYRFSDYTVKGNGIENDFTTDTYAAGLTWAPSSDLLVRGQFQRAVRAPNIIELFSAQNTGLFDLAANPDGSFDDCAGPTPFRTLEECRRTGVVAPGEAGTAVFGSIPDNAAGQFNAITGGNPLLQPEESDTFTVGVVWTPSQIAGLAVSIDYFDIVVDDAISTIPPTQAFEQCLDTGDAAFCDLIQRDNAGSLFLDNSSGGITATNVNIAELSTTGVDVSVTYGFDLDKLGFQNKGSVDIDYVSTFLDSLDTVPLPGADAIECVDLYGGDCGTPNPEYRHRASATWSTPWDVTATMTWRHFGGVEQDAADTGTINDEFDAVNYIDLFGSWDVNETVTLRAGMNNVFDEDPPLSSSVGAGFGNGNTFPGVYDATGRFVFVGANLKF